MDSEECLFCKCFKDAQEKRKQRELAKAEISLECKDHLHNWEKWIKERKRVNESLEKRLKRPTNQLLMNVCEEKRKIMEEQILFENKRNFLYFDKLRGNPEFWKLAPRYYQRSKDDPIIEARQTKAEKKEMTPIVYVQTPLHILQEKGILPRTRNMLQRWQKVPYRQAIYKKITTKMKFLEPHRPKLSNVLVVGKKMTINVEDDSDSLLLNQPKKEDYCEDRPCNVKEVPNCTCSTYSPEDNKSTKDSSVSIKLTPIPIYSFIINGHDISATSLEQRQMKIRILFAVDEIPTIPLQKLIVFENSGQTTMRVYFHKNKKFLTFRDIIPNIRKSSSFYFNKTELLVLPGSEVKLPIWFKPTTTGHFIETWRLTTKPPIWPEEFNLTVVFQGIVYKEDFYKKSESIQQMLEARIRNNLIKEIVDDILEVTRYDEKPPIAYTFTEKDLFESINMTKWGPANWPKYLYNKQIVRQLSTFYQEVKYKDDPPYWNYSIQTLKEITRKKDVLVFVDTLNKECHRVLERAKVLNESPHEELEEKNVIPEKMTTSGEPEEVQGNILKDYLLPEGGKIVYTNYEKLIKILQKLERPVMHENKEREKYAMVFFILRFYFTKIAAELDDYGLVRYFTDINYANINKIQDLPERLIYERFDPIWIVRSRRNQTKVDKTIKNIYPEKPKPDYLEHIPLEDTSAIYTTYFKRVSQEKKDRLKTKSTMMRAASQGKLKSKTGLSKSNSEFKRGKSCILAAEVKEDFDPYADLPQFPAINSNFSQYLPKYTAVTRRLDYYGPDSQTSKNKYIIIYTYLCQAVDAMVNAIETMKESKLPIESLGELAKCNIVTSGAPYDEVSMQMDTFDTSEDYYQNLVETYLQDKHTQDFYVKGKKLAFIEKLQEYFKPSATELSIIKSWKSQEFAIDLQTDDLFRTTEMQTSECNEFIQAISNILLRDDVVSHHQIFGDERSKRTEIEAEAEENQESEIFYFVDSNEYLPEFITPELSTQIVLPDEIW